METYYTEGDLPGEIWNPVVLPDRYENRYKFSGLYEVSNMGRVRSATRKVYITKGDYSKKTWEYPWYTHLGQLIRPYDETATPGFLVFLSTNRYDELLVLISILVAVAFIPNPNNYKYALPKDEDRSNCCASNLYWSNSKYTESEKKRVSEAKLGNTNSRKPVYCVTNNTRYESCMEAELELLGKSDGTVSWACKGKYGSGNGHIYKKLGLEFWYLKEWEELYGPVSK